MATAETVLIVPRKQIFFTPSEGRFVGISPNVPDFLKQPLIRADAGSIPGLESGYRSGLLEAEGQLYKLKGCRPSGGLFHRAAPRGSQTFSLAEYEADRILETREAFLREGVPYPVEPVGFWVYDQFLYKGEPNAATIYRANGETRLDELLWWIEKDLPYRYIPDEARERITSVFQGFGLMTGRMLKIFHNNQFSWDSHLGNSSSNVHLGNVLVFPDKEGRLRVGIVDFDNAVTFNPDMSVDSMRVAQEHDLENLTARIKFAEIFSGARRFRPSLDLLSNGLIDRILRQIPLDHQPKDLSMFRRRLVNNLMNGTDTLSRIDVADAVRNGYQTDGLQDDLGGTLSELLELKGYARRLKREFAERVMRNIQELTSLKEIDEPFNGIDLLEPFKKPPLLIMKEKIYKALAGFIPFKE